MLISRSFKWFGQKHLDFLPSPDHPLVEALSESTYSERGYDELSSEERLRDKGKCYNKNVQLSMYVQEWVKKTEG